MASEKTEKPTRKKLDDARKKGQIPRSRDLALAAASVAATFALAKLGGRLVHGLALRLESDLASFGDASLRTVSSQEITGMVAAAGLLMLTLVGPIALATMAAGVGTHGFQGGWSFNPEALQFKWDRLNPANNVKNLGIMKSGLDTMKTLVSVAALAYLGWLAVDAVTKDTLRMPWLSPLDSALVGWEHTERMLWRVAVTLGLLALGDYGLQWFRTMRDLKMSRQEVIDEGKEQEGNAEVKSRVRRVQREMARRRMLGDVKKATVVITNPTHFAIALEYNRDTMVAPRVLAKGRDHMALRIREAARKHGVPIVENKPLAQTLYKTTEVGDTIPASLFSAVAEVLAYLVRIRQLMF
jgi:flagellar biosynthetic protein FlhB